MEWNSQPGTLSMFNIEWGHIVTLSSPGGTEIFAWMQIGLMGWIPSWGTYVTEVGSGAGCYLSKRATLHYIFHMAGGSLVWIKLSMVILTFSSSNTFQTLQEKRCVIYPEGFTLLLFALWLLLRTYLLQDIVGIYSAENQKLISYYFKTASGSCTFGTL
jgi:hypothetical protein